MLLSIKSWLFEVPSKDCMARYAISGDNRHLEQLIALYSNDLYHYLVTQSSTHLAYDVSQQTWLKVIEKRHLYQAQTTPKARKTRTSLSHAQQQALKHIVTKKLSFALQLTSLTCALGLLAFIVLDSKNVINTAPNTVLNTIDIRSATTVHLGWRPWGCSRKVHKVPSSFEGHLFLLFYMTAKNERYARAKLTIFVILATSKLFL